MQFYFRLTTILLTGILLTACAANQTQQEVAREFWTAIAADNQDKAKAYALHNDLSQINTIDALLIQKIDLKAHQDSNGQALVPTAITALERGEPKTVSFSTILRKESGDWKVDLIKTGEAIKAALGAKK